MENFDVAQICINGHVVNQYSTTSPEFNQKFCEKCGVATITKCQNCQTDIKGQYLEGGLIPDPYIRPKYCYNCGKPYPWTEIVMTSTYELARTTSLTESEISDLQSNIQELIKNSPKVPVAQIKVKSYFAKAGKDIGQAMKEILVDMVSETIKKVIWPS